MVLSCEMKFLKRTDDVCLFGILNEFDQFNTVLNVINIIKEGDFKAGGLWVDDGHDIIFIKVIDKFGEFAHCVKGNIYTADLYTKQNGDYINPRIVKGSLKLYKEMPSEYLDSLL